MSECELRFNITERAKEYPKFYTFMGITRGVQRNFFIPSQSSDWISTCNSTSCTSLIRNSQFPSVPHQLKKWKITKKINLKLLVLYAVNILSLLNLGHGFNSKYKYDADLWLLKLRRRSISHHINTCVYTYSLSTKKRKKLWPEKKN